MVAAMFLINARIFHLISKHTLLIDECWAKLISGSFLPEWEVFNAETGGTAKVRDDSALL